MAQCPRVFHPTLISCRDSISTIGECVRGERVSDDALDNTIARCLNQCHTTITANDRQHVHAVLGCMCAVYCAMDQQQRVIVRIERQVKVEAADAFEWGRLYERESHNGALNDKSLSPFILICIHTSRTMWQFNSTNFFLFLFLTSTSHQCLSPSPFLSQHCIIRQN